MFSGPVRTEWVEGSERTHRLLESVVFTDSQGVEWVAREGEVVDGASIPRFFWRVIGSPFVGKFRRASVIHDVYCVRRDRPSKDVHKMFHEAMLADGVGSLKAWTMYQAVRFGGPDWE